jgi:hypothetical protein
MAAGLTEDPGWTAEQNMGQAGGGLVLDLAPTLPEIAARLDRSYAGGGSVYRYDPLGSDPSIYGFGPEHLFLVPITSDPGLTVASASGSGSIYDPLGGHDRDGSSGMGVGPADPTGGFDPEHNPELGLRGQDPTSDFSASGAWSGAKAGATIGSHAGLPGLVAGLGLGALIGAINAAPSTQAPNPSEIDLEAQAAAAAQNASTYAGAPDPGEDSPDGEGSGGSGGGGGGYDANGGLIHGHMQARSRSRDPGKLVDDPSPGRADRIATRVPANSYIVPADVVSGLGQGNTDAGARRLRRMLMKVPPFRSAAPTKPVPVRLSGGEYHVPPAIVAGLGGGSVARGALVLEHLVHTVRDRVSRHMRTAPPPKR